MAKFRIGVTYAEIGTKKRLTNFNSMLHDGNNLSTIQKLNGNGSTEQSTYEILLSLSIARSRTSLKARQLIFNAFIMPYLHLMYIRWPLLSTTTIDTIETKNRQLYQILKQQQQKLSVFCVDLSTKLFLCYLNFSKTTY